MCGPSGPSYFPAMHAWPISPYENRSSGYRSRTDFPSLAPSPKNLTGKPSLTYSVGPCAVELFTGQAFSSARSPTESPVGRSCHHAVAPGTSRVKGTHAQCVSPAEVIASGEGVPLLQSRGRDFHPLNYLAFPGRTTIRYTFSKNA